MEVLFTTIFENFKGGNEISKKFDSDISNRVKELSVDTIYL